MRQIVSIIEADRHYCAENAQFEEFYFEELSLPDSLKRFDADLRWWDATLLQSTLGVIVSNAQVGE